MEEKVWKLRNDWRYIQDSDKVMREHCQLGLEFDDIAYVPITDEAKMQVCIIRKKDKYGVFILDHTNGFGGSGTWCNPMVDPFPYDEVKYCSFPWDYPNEFGLFAFRLGNEWGIIKVVAGDNEEKGYDVVYGLTKCRIIVPCEYPSLAEAELQLGKEYNWEEPPFEGES